MTRRGAVPRGRMRRGTIRRAAGPLPVRLALGLLLGSLAACGQRASASLARPSAVLYDAAADVYLVADLGATASHSGAVHVIGPEDGDVSALVTDAAGLRAPRGLALVGDTLWVADVDTLRRFDRATGAPRGAVEVVGASALHGLTADDAGALYVCDPEVDVIWRVPPDGAPEVLARGADLAGPTSVSAQRGGVYAVGGRDGSFYQVDYRGVRTELGRAPQAGLSGLVRVAGAADAADPRRRTPSWLAASRDGAAVYRFSLTGGVEALPQRFEQPGGLAYDGRRRRLLVPLTDAGRLRVEPL